MACVITKKNRPLARHSHLGGSPYSSRFGTDYWPVHNVAHHFGHSRILISAPIVAENSGGPVLDSRNRVIGIAATGADKFQNTAATLNHGVIRWCSVLPRA
jgi:hypothetical protein